MVLTFTGDISVTGSFVEKIKTDSEIFSTEIKNTLIESNFVVCNLEAPTTDYKHFINKNTPLKSPVNTIEYLSKRNIKTFNLANNHILDYDENGLKDTLKYIKQQNCFSFGAGLNKEEAIRSLILNTGGITVGLIAITKTNPSKVKNAQVFSSNDFKTLKKEIIKLKEKVDFIIINFHGGEEYTDFPSPVKRRFLKKIASLKNVDCIIAHHSHTLQGYEKYKNTPVFYSLGNFIFDIPNHKIHNNTNVGALLTLKFTKQNFTFNFVPFEILEGEIINYSKKSFKTTIKRITDFKDYKEKWQKEAFRTLFRKENKKITKIDSNSLQKKSFLNLLFSKKFYLKVFRILKDEYMLSLYISAVLYRIKKRKK